MTPDQKPSIDKRSLNFSEALEELKAGKKIRPLNNAGGYFLIDPEGILRFHQPGI